MGGRWTDRLLLREVEAVELHDLRPSGDEVVHELRLTIGAGVDLGQGAELRVGAEDEVDGGRIPLHLAGLAVAAFEEVLADLGLLPDHGLVEEVDEEVVGQGTRLLGQHAEAREEHRRG